MKYPLICLTLYYSVWLPTSHAAGIISLDLEPSLALLHREQLHYNTKSNDNNVRRRRLLDDNESGENENDKFNSIEASMLLQDLESLSGVYASMTEIEINNTYSEQMRRLIQEHNEKVKDLNKIRHKSRYEQYEEETNDAEIVHSHRKLQQWGDEIPAFGGGGGGGAGSLDGGLYSEFHSVPLAQGYGTHYVTLWVGSDTPQRKTLIVDTGSHHTAFPCRGCKRCGEKHHTDKYFDPEMSKTFHTLTCRECMWGAKCETLNIGSDDGDQGNILSIFSMKKQDMNENTSPSTSFIGEPEGCVFQQAYTEGSSWKAFQVQDQVFVGGKDVFSAADPIAKRYAINFTFGCQTFSSGLFVSQLADGIMGLSQHDATLPRAMYNQGKLSNRMFGLCFRTEMVVSKKGISAGAMTLGGVDRRLHSTPMVWARNLARTGWFTVYVKKLYLRPNGGNSAKIDDHENIIPITADLFSINSGKGVILDSGTTDTYLHKSLAKPFQEAWKKVTGKQYTNLPVKLTREQLAKLPTILIQLLPFDNGEKSFGVPDNIVGLVGSKLDRTNPSDVLIAVPATHYMEYSPSKNVYTSRFYFTESRGGVLGANTLQGHDVVFDWDYGRIGFAESSCKVNDMRENRQGLVSEGTDARGADCIFQNPVVTKSCLSTVDTSICTRDNPDEILSGYEEWAMVVEYPGTDRGMSCQDVVRRKMIPGTSLDGIEVTCDNAGLCTSKQKCQIACRYAAPVEPQPEPTGQDGSPNQCPKGEWGACLETCHQSKVSSSRMSDGKCYEDISTREQRECHTEFCGISDPCLIPFVVHIILAFRGVDHTAWNKNSERIIIEAFSDAVKDQNGENLFQPSDVEILMISPWYQDILDISGSAHENMSQILGSKLVMEVHMYNEKATLPALKTVGASKITSMMQRRADTGRLSECKNSDVFNLAQRAHKIHFVLKDSEFMQNMGNSLEKYHQQIEQNEMTAFTALMQNEQYVKESIVFSSWTIKTEVGGSSVYDHELDPYPHPLHYAKITPAYFGFLTPSRIAYLMLPILVSLYIARRKKYLQESKKFSLGGALLSNTASTFSHKPFDLVKRKFVSSSRKSVSSVDLNSVRSESDKSELNSYSSSHKGDNECNEYYPILISKNNGDHSRLSNIINN